MDTQLIDRRISCPYCGEFMDIVIDVSAGGQAYIEDCQICCRPMNVSFDTENDLLVQLRIQRAD